MSFIVTGATGHLGALIVESLLARGVAPDVIVATGRNSDRLAELSASGVRTEVFDFNNPTPQIFDEADTLILVSSSEVGQRVAQHQAVIEVAQRAHVGRIIYTSAPRANSTPLPLAAEHRATEEILIGSGVPYTILRNGWYNENYEGAFNEARETGTIVGSAGSGKVSSAARRDYAEAAAVVATTEGHVNQTYELGGDTAWTFAELAQTFSALLDTTVDYHNVSAEEQRELLESRGLPDGLIDFLVTMDTNIEQDALHVEGYALSSLIGRATTPMIETAKTWL